MPDNPIILDVLGEDNLELEFGETEGIDFDTQPYSKGNPGESAYQIAVDNGFLGTEAEWLASLHGADGSDGSDGSDGKSAYEIAVEQGFVGSESDWLDSLVGPQGSQGIQGPQGIQGIQGETGQRGVAGNDGFSPTATVSKSGDTATISITDKNGTTTATVKDGADGSTDWSGITNKPTFATVATSGSYADLSNKPSIPTVPSNVSAFTNDAGYLTSHQDISGKVDIAGDTMTGALIAPSFQTGSTASNYFQTQKMRGEGTADTYYHAIDFGYSGHNQVDFYEYGGIWRFHKHTAAAVGSGDTLVGKITSNGWEGSAKLTGTPTAPTASAGTNNTQIATTAFVNNAVPTKTSDLTNDSGFITSESDPVFNASAAHGITSTDITNWNNKSDFSGSYNDLTNKPTIPTVPTKLSAFTDDLGSSPTHTHRQYLTSYTESDPVFSASAAAGISSSDIAAWDGKQSALTFDNTPTSGSDNPVKSGGIYNVISSTNSNLAWVENGTKASRAYGTGDRFIDPSGNLCMTTAYVPNNGTLTQGTNYNVISTSGGGFNNLTVLFNNASLHDNIFSYEAINIIRVGNMCCISMKFTALSSGSNSKILYDLPKSVTGLGIPIYDTTASAFVPGYIQSNASTSDVGMNSRTANHVYSLTCAYVCNINNQYS